MSVEESAVLNQESPVITSPEVVNEPITTAAPVIPGKETPAPEYAPNYKFTAYDKEYEIDDWARSIIKDKETEEKARTLWAKAYGLDGMKEKYTKLKEKHEPIEKQYTQLTGSIAQLDEMVKKGDYHTFFKSLGIPEDKILKYALDVANYRELPPDQRQQIDGQRQAQEQNMLLQQQNMQWQSQMQEHAVMTRNMQLDMELSKPEISEMAKEFDARVGTPGAFRQEAIRRGQLAHFTSGQDIPAGQAVQEVLQLFGKSPTVATTTGNPQTRAKPPVIPNLQGQSKTPIKKIPKSLDDLRKMAKEMQN